MAFASFRSGAEYFQPYVRILRVNGLVLSGEPIPVVINDANVPNQVFTISVNPGTAAVSWTLFKIDDLTTVASGSAAAGGLQTIAVASSFFGSTADVLFLLRFTGGTGAASAACEVEITTQLI